MRIFLPAHSVCKNLALILLVGIGGSLWAAPSPPPLLCVEDGDCVETEPVVDEQEPGHSNPDGRYGLEDAIRGLPFTVNTPVPPQIESEQVVTPSTLGNYINRSGVRLILEPGNYGNRTFNSQDQQIVLREGVFFGNVSIGGSARRISIRNEVPRSGNMTSLSMPEGGWGGFPEDILIDGIRSDVGNDVNYFHGQRMAIINSFIRAFDFPLSAFNGRYNDIIIANSNLESYGDQQAGVRFHNINRFVFVDNRVSKTSGDKHVFRLHGGGGADIDYAYISRNQMGNVQQISINPQGTGTPTSDVFHDIWFEDNNLHAQSTYGPGFISVHENTGGLLRFRVRGNNFYGPASTSNIFVTPVNAPVPYEPGWVVEGNTITGFQAPPPWEFR